MWLQPGAAAASRGAGYGLLLEVPSEEEEGAGAQHEAYLGLLLRILESKMQSKCYLFFSQPCAVRSVSVACEKFAAFVASSKGHAHIARWRLN